MRKDYYKDERGYYRYRGSGKLVHRFIASKYVVGRPLRAGEVVHHINGNKLDNRPKNLQVMTWEEHSALHRRMRSRGSVMPCVKVLLIIITFPISVPALLIYHGWFKRRKRDGEGGAGSPEN